MPEPKWTEIGGFWAIQLSSMNWLVLSEKRNLETVIGGISMMGPKWFAAYVFHPVHAEDGSYLGDSDVPTVVGWGDDLVGAATGFHASTAGAYIEGDFVRGL